MSEVVYIKKKLSDLFICKSGNSKYTKSYCNLHNGKYEVYTGSTLQKFASLDTYDYNEPNLTFTTDGEYAGTLKVLEGKYNVGGHRKILIKKDKNIDLNYFCTILQPLFYAKVKDGDVPSVNWNKQLSKLLINVPINKDGTYNIDKQREIAFKFQEIEDKKKNLLNKIEYLKKTNIDTDNINYKYKEIPLNELFIPKGGNMLLSKEFCKDNEGKYPVYSGSTSSDVYATLNTYDYDGKYLTWVIDGLAGYMKITDGKFSITCHRGILLPTEKCKNIDLLYVKYVLEPIFRKRKRGRMGINGKNEYTALKPTHIKKYNDKIKIPIDVEGNFDIEKQKEFAQKIATFEKIKEDLIAKLIELVNISIKL